METLGWSQSELARQADVCPSIIGEIVNLKRRPSQKIVNKIELAFLDAGVCVDVLSEWPEMFTMKGKSMSYYQDIETERLLQNQSLSLENNELIQMFFDKLSPLEIDIIMMNRVENISMVEIGKKYGLSTAVVSIHSRKLDKKIYEFNQKLGLDGTKSNKALSMYFGVQEKPIWLNEKPFKFIETENKKAFSGRFPHLSKRIVKNR